MRGNSSSVWSLPLMHPWASSPPNPISLLHRLTFMLLQQGYHTYTITSFPGLLASSSAHLPSSSSRFCLGRALPCFPACWDGYAEPSQQILKAQEVLKFTFETGNHQKLMPVPDSMHQPLPVADLRRFHPVCLLSALA